MARLKDTHPAGGWVHCFAPLRLPPPHHAVEEALSARGLGGGRHGVEGPLVLLLLVLFASLVALLDDLRRQGSQASDADPFSPCLGPLPDSVLFHG